jgi:hypothetical protein
MKTESIPAISTNEVANAFAFNALVPGPVWTSFEHFRRGGTGILESVPEHGVATLRSKVGIFRVMRDSDFQGLIGLASEVHRLQIGLKFVVKAARVALKHPDKEHFELLIQSTSLITEFPELPQRTGHGSFHLTPGEVAEESSEDFDLATAKITRPW